MWCRRCQGLMVQDRWTDLPREAERTAGPIYRCLSCGEVIDPVILTNRRRHRRRARLPIRRFAAMVSSV